MREAFDYYVAVGDGIRALAVAAHPIPPVWEPTDIPSVIARALKLVSEDSLDRGRLLSTSGWFLATHERDHDRAEVAFRSSLEIARQHTDEALERRTLVTAAHADYWHMKWDSCRERGLRAVELASRANDHRTEMSAREWPARVAAIKGAPDEAKLHGAAAVELGERLRERHGLANAYMYSGWLYALQGDWRSTRQFSDDALALQPREPRNLATRALLEIQTGALSKGESYLTQLLDPERITKWSLLEKFGLAAFIPMAARMTGDEERLDLAKETAHAALAAPGMPPFMRLYGRIGLAFVAILRDDHDAGAEQYEAFHSQRGTAIVMAGLSVDRLLGLLSLVSGRHETALGHFDEALVFCRRAGYEPEYAWAASDSAAALSRQALCDHHERTTILQHEALSIARRLGMRPLEARISARTATPRRDPHTGAAYS